MDYLVKQHVEDIAKSYGLRWNGSIWAGKECPWCGTSRSGNDKFNFWEDGGWKCWACERSGDFINWLRDPPGGDKGLTCAEAHEFINAACLSSSCPYMDKCRITRGGRRKPKDTALPGCGKGSAHSINIVNSLIFPHPDWVKVMTGLVDKAAVNIVENKEILQWLSDRGVSLSVVRSAKIGLLKHDESVPVDSLGMIKSKHGECIPHGVVGHNKDRLWVPGGLVLPVYSHGELFCFEVRRPLNMREKYLPNITYLFTKGGGRGYRTFWHGGGGKLPQAVVVIESYLDAQVVSSACPEVAVIFGKDKPMLKSYAESFRRSPLILVCMDNDQPNKEGKRAGEQKAILWEAEFDNAHFWPVPVGKDPGEYFRDHGGDIRSWIMGGIDKFSKKIFPVPDRDKPKKESSEKNNISDNLDDVIEIEIYGETVYLVRNSKMLQKIAAHDKIVFSQDELDIIKKDFGKLSKEQALQLFEVKKVFGDHAATVFAAQLENKQKTSKILQSFVDNSWFLGAYGSAKLQHDGIKRLFR